MICEDSLGLEVQAAVLASGEMAAADGVLTADGVETDCERALGGKKHRGGKERHARRSGGH